MIMPHSCNAKEICFPDNEGEKEYAKVMAASEYYFSDVEMFLLDCAS